MDWMDAALHAWGFVLPALVVACVVSFSGRFLKHRGGQRFSFLLRAAINFAVCLIVLSIGLALTGRDGKMISYAAMVLASGTVQWLMSGGWRP
jgi:hypothetical protein